MSFNQGNRGNSGSGLGGPAPGCCSRKIGGKPSGRGIGKTGARQGVGNPRTSARPGFGTGRGIGRGGGIKR